MKDAIARSLRDAHSMLGEFLASEQNLAAIEVVADEIVTCFRAGNKILVAGNGGSMADALHFAEEWTGRFRNERRPFPVMALGESTHLTCVGNDYGFECIFSRMVEAFGKPGDLLFLLSTSGNSPNLILAAQAAKNAEVSIIGFLGRGGGSLLPLCDAHVMAPGETSDRIQEIHMLVLHVLIEVAEMRLSA